jgi:DMSO/TMAO reductase YedYZ heme-binding membrane subunit
MALAAGEPLVRPGRTTDATLGHMAGILGYAAFFFMAAAVVWGVLLVSRMMERHIRRSTVYGGHMLLSILALTASLLHAFVHYFRHDAFFDLKKLFVPWFGGADTVVSIGIVGLELLFVVAFSIWLQRRLSYRRWHRLHWCAYPGFVLIALHSVLASREQHFSIIWVAIAAALFVVGAVAVLRVYAPAARADAPDIWFDVPEEYRDGTYLR